MQEKIIKLKNLLQEFEDSRANEIISSISEIVNSISKLELNISMADKKNLVLAEMTLSMVIKKERHPKMIINNLKKYINILENIKIEDIIAA